MTTDRLDTAAPLRPFLHWPTITDPARWNGPACLIGVPYSEHYKGELRPNDQASAPDAIRLMTSQFYDGPERHDFDLGATLGALLPPGAFDAGNCIDPDVDFDAGFDRTVERMKRLFSSTQLVCVLGGDHGATIPVLHGLEAVGQPVHVVQIDAHLDWRDEVGGVRRGYSSPMRRASELPFVSGITQIGLRGTGSARAGEFRDAVAHGATLFTAEAVHRDGMGVVLEHLRGKGPFYLTIDADGLDPSEMPAVLGPVPGGLRASQVLPLIRALAHDRLVGIDVVEVAPSFDPANHITSIAAGRFLINAIGYSFGAGATA